jgi:hypothetical protein
MAVYVVMEPPRDGAGRDEIYVRDGFHVLGFLLPLVWLLWNRLWIETLVLLGAMLGLGLLGESSGSAELLVGALSLLVSIYVGIEGPALRIWALRRRGYTEWGVVEAHDRADAETRYLAESATGDAGMEPSPWPAVRPAEGRALPATEPQLGLLGYPGRT